MQQLNYQSEVQPCLAAKGFREQVISVARDYFSGRPEPFPGAYRGTAGGFFSVMPNDTTNMWAVRIVGDCIGRGAVLPGTPATTSGTSSTRWLGRSARPTPGR